MPSSDSILENVCLFNRQSPLAYFSMRRTTSGRHPPQAATKSWPDAVASDRDCVLLPNGLEELSEFRTVPGMLSHDLNRAFRMASDKLRDTTEQEAPEPLVCVAAHDD